jgi:hypothetical protein
VVFITKESRANVRYSQKHPMKPFLITWVAFLLFMMLLAVVFPGLRERTDFPCFYAGGLLARTQPSQLYDLARQRRVEADAVGWSNGWTMFIQPPYEALFLEPFSLLPYRTAYLTYLALNVVLLVPCFLLARDAFSNVIDPWQLQPGLMFFFFLPLWLALFQGQASIRLLLLCCAAWYALKRGEDFPAGFFLALGLFKMQLIIPLVFLLVVWRGVRLLLGFLAGFVAVIALSVWMVGVAGVREFLKLLLVSSLVAKQASSTAAETGQIPTLMPNLRGLVYGCGGKYLPHYWLLGVTLMVSAALVLWIVCLLRSRRDEATSFALALIAAVLLSYHFHTHDLTVVLLALGLLAGRHRPRFDTIVLVFFLLPVVLLFFSPRAHFWMAIPLLVLIALVGRDGQPKPIAESMAAQTA